MALNIIDQNDEYWNGLEWKMDFPTGGTNIYERHVHRKDIHVTQQDKDRWDNIQGLKFKIVDVLPEIGEAGYIYLVKKSEPGQGDLYDEFVWIVDSTKPKGGYFEQLGKIDLRDYWTSAQTQNAINIEASARQSDDQTLQGEIDVLSGDVATIDYVLAKTTNTFKSKIGLEDDLSFPTAFTYNDVVEGINAKQDKLVSGTNIKTINGKSIVGFGNTNIVTYNPFPNNWSTSGTLESVVNSMLSDSTLTKAGMAYLGGIAGQCTPFGYGNVECKVEFMLDGLAVLSVNSSDIEPYSWFYNTASGDYVWRKSVMQYTQNNKEYLKLGNVTISEDQLQALLNLLNN